MRDERPRRPRRPARPRADRGQHLPRALTGREAPARVRRPGRRAGARRRRPHRRRAGAPGALAARLLPPPRRSVACRSSTRSTDSATAAASPPVGSSRSSTVRRSSTCRRASTATSRAPTTSCAMPEGVPDSRVAARLARRGMAPYREQLGELYDRPRPIDLRYAGGDPMSRKGTSATASGCGCAPTARCPTTRSLHACIVTYASDMTLLDTAVMPFGLAWDSARRARWPASTTRCGSTARSAPTSGCCTTSAPSRRVVGAWTGGRGDLHGRRRARRERRAGGPDPDRPHPV